MRVGLFASSATKAVIKPSKFDRFRLVLNDLKIMHQCLAKQRQVLGRKDGACAWWFTHIDRSLCSLAKLIHRIVFAACLQRSFTGKIFLMVITNVGTRHILVLDAGDALTDFLALDTRDIA